jgi:hypothetical protein
MFSHFFHMAKDANVIEAAKRVLDPINGYFPRAKTEG